MTQKSYDASGFRDSDGGVLLNATVIRRTIRQSKLTINTSAVAIPTIPLAKRISLVIMNNSISGQIVYLGDASVTTVDGFPLYPRATILVQLEDEATIYGIASAVDADVRIIEGA